MSWFWHIDDRTHLRNKHWGHVQTGNSNHTEAALRDYRQDAKRMFRPCAPTVSSSDCGNFVKRLSVRMSAFNFSERSLTSSFLKLAFTRAVPILQRYVQPAQ